MAEPISLSLGIAVGKAVFKSWFKENEFAESMADSIGDLISRVVPEWTTKSAAQRQIERLSGKAALALQPIIDSEFGSLIEGEKKTAIFEVQKAIDNLNINSRMLADNNYEPIRIQKEINNVLFTSSLNEGGRQLAWRLSNECSQMIIDLSSSFPTFHRDSYSEILSREEIIIDSVDRIFSELERIREQSLSASHNFSASEFEQSYRRSIVRKLDRIELFGLNSSANPTSRQHNLSTAYISLSVSSTILQGENDNEGDADSSNEAATNNQGAAASIRVEDVAALAPRIVIKGEAGSGKTTLLQSLAVRCATGSFPEELEEWNALIPFFISLRTINGELPPPEDFPKQITTAVAGTMPVGWVHDRLSEGRGLILVDGLDEVSESRRNATKSWIEDLLTHYPECRLLVTSRPPAVPDGWLAKQQFADIELLPMSPTDVSTFIDHWHEAVAKEEHDQAAATQTLALASKLKGRIRADRALRELASTPLLCAMLCAMNRDRKEVLPSNRMSLYEAAVQLVLHNRDEQRRVKVDDLPALDFETKRDLLQNIALWMMENSLSMADEWRIVDLVKIIIPRFPRLGDRHSAVDIVKSLLLRSGLLRSPVEDKCDFIHNAFKEYLCARAISEGDKFGFLEANVSASESWREVAPMAAAITDDKRRSDFLRSLLKRGDESSSKRAMYHLLAVRCLETCTQLEPSLQGEILSRIQGLKPPRSVTEAKALSAAGDLATPLVRRTPGQHARTAASCVRALRMIGTPQALETLEGYGPDSRGTVVKELLAAWPFFDRREYAKRIMSQSRGLWGGLRISEAEALEGIAYLNQLQRIQITSRRQLTTLEMSELSGLLSLVDLTLFTEGSFDASYIGNLPQLSSIRIRCGRLSGISSVNRMPKLSSIDLFAAEAEELSEIDLSKCHAVKLSGKVNWSSSSIRLSDRLAIFSIIDEIEDFDFSVLKECSSLKDLTLRYDSLNSFIHHCNTNDKIRDLHVAGLHKVKSLSFLEYFPNLRTLNLPMCKSLPSLAGIENCSDIHTVNITRADDLTTLSSIEELKKLTVLRISSTNDDLDFSPLEEMSNLTALHISPNLFRKVKDLDLPCRVRSTAY